MRHLFTFLSILLCSSFTLGQTLVGFSGINSTNFAPNTPPPTGLSSTNLVAGSGITSISGTGGCNSQPRMNIGSTNSWPTSQNANYSISFTLTAASTHKAYITGVSLTQRRTNAGPTDYNIMIGTTDNTGSVSTTCQTSASAGSMDSIPAGSSKTFTIFYYRPGGGSTGGNLDFNDIVVSGTVVPLMPLPVKLTSLNASTLDAKNIIKWQTASEINNDYFEILHSDNFKDYTVIGKVRGKGNTTESISYDFIHEKPSHGKNFYKIKQVDYDGQSETFGPVSVNYDGKELMIYPNATDDFINIVNPYGTTAYTIYSISGIKVAEGLVENTLNISNLSNGLYILEIEGRPFKFIKK